MTVEFRLEKLFCFEPIAGYNHTLANKHFARMSHSFLTNKHYANVSLFLHATPNRLPSEIVPVLLQFYRTFAAISYCAAASNGKKIFNLNFIPLTCLNTGEETRVRVTRATGRAQKEGELTNTVSFPIKTSAA